MASPGVEAGHDARDVGQHRPDMRNHRAVVDAGGRRLLRLELLGVLATFRPVGQFACTPREGPGAGRAEVRVEAPASPGGLDDEHVLAQPLLHRDAEGELGTDLVLRRPEPGCQPPRCLGPVGVGVAKATHRGDPRSLAGARRAAGIAHLREERCGLRVIGHRVEGGDGGVPLHV
ncbi:MAG: hypothetical protein ACK55I_05570, partial [bacterium]